MKSTIIFHLIFHLISPTPRQWEEIEEEIKGKIR
jgi:hypothetical protein